MRAVCVVATLLIAASAPAAAVPAQTAAAQTAAAQTAAAPVDPAAADSIANAVDAISKVLLDLRVGAVRAAIENRVATAEESRMTVRDWGTREDPEFSRKIERRIAAARPMIQQSMKAFTEALPAITRSLKQVDEAVGRAAANLPDPNYPKR